MKFKIISIFIVSVIVLIHFCVSKIRKQSDEIEFYKQNTNYILMETERYKTKDSLNVISIQQLNVKIRQYKESEMSNIEEIKQLKVDIKRLSGIGTVQTQTITQIITKVKDSIVYVNQVPEKIQCIDYKSKWLDILGCIIDREFRGTIKNRDSLTFVEHFVPKKFLFIKFGVKLKKLDIVSKNPDTEFLNATYTRFK